MIEQTSDQILGLLGRFNEQWGKYNQSLESVKRKFDSVQKDFDQLLGTRKRALERPLVELETIRREKGLAVDGVLFELGSADLDTHRRSLRDVRELGA
jgi:DNA recombination protein RmuC